MKRPRDIMIFLVVVLAMGTFIAPKLYAQGGHGEIGAFYIEPGEDGCAVCHDTTFPGLPDGSQTGLELMWVREVIDASGYGGPNRIPPDPGTIDFSTFVPGDPFNPVGAFVDGNGNGICEVCHTKTNYYRKYPPGHPDSKPGIGVHWPKQKNGDWIHWDCTDCHFHFRKVNKFWFEPNLIGDQSHETHLTDAKGPMFTDRFGDDDCEQCHWEDDRHYFRDSTFPDDMRDKAATHVCDDCHSKGGAFGGADYAKSAWTDGAYDPLTALKELKDEHKNWCAHCHDDVPDGKIASEVRGVDAPNIMGDNAQTYGYNVTGHGRMGLASSDYIKCHRCHDLRLPHTESEPRTYEVAEDNYVQGYRLAFSMDIPKQTSDYSQQRFELCFVCHDYDVFFDPTGPYLTAFRNDYIQSLRNLHYVHMGPQGAVTTTWNSDWDPYGGIDSAASCLACHQAHGSPTSVMTRNGELIGHPGQALDFTWLDQNGDPTDIFLKSFGAYAYCDDNDITGNYICVGCHDWSQGSLYYERSSGQVIVTKVSTNKQFYNPGDSIRYKVEFTILPKESVLPQEVYYVKAVGKAFAKSGTYWETKLDKALADRPPNDYVWTWNEQVPWTANPGSGAKVKITVKLRRQAGGPLIYERMGTASFQIKP